jgi:hypothetical protein
VNDSGGIVPDDLAQLFADYEETKASVRRTLEAFFRSAGRRAFVAGGIPVDAPGEPSFTPDVLVVLDVEPRERAAWSVAEEGRGLDLVLQVYFDGDPDEPYRRDLERCARLGVVEYFVFDCLDPRLEGYRLAPAVPGEARGFRPITPEAGRFRSAVLGLDLLVEGARLGLRDGAAPLLDRGDPAVPEPEASTRRVRFERHEGTGYPLRAVYPDGSWLAVNRASEGLFAGDPRGRIVQVLGRERFRATSPRQFAQEYQRVYGQRLSDRTEALGPRDAAALHPDGKRG